jgi:ApaG protein
MTELSSEAITHGVRVVVHPQFVPERSDPRAGHWFFAYQVTIENQGDRPCRLVSRHWIITDGTGQTREVRGPGVVGETPRLAPGEHFTYTSGCPLPTSLGAMHGSFQMVSDSGDTFEVEVAPFVLCDPDDLN